MAKVCDVCESYIRQEQSFHHCNICGDGDFDICEECHAAGKRCHDASHVLLHHRVRGDAIVDAKTGNLVRYLVFRSCPGCTWDRSDRPQEDSEWFKYKAFPDDSYIRVFELFPGQDGEPLRYALHFARLGAQSMAQYVAISYVCGDVSAKVPSFCNGRRLDIYASLDRALRKWRQAEKQNWLRIWADAICINQDDSQEKSAQVAGMHRIYRNANQIFVCLDDPPEEVDLALELISRLSEDSRRESKVTKKSQENDIHEPVQQKRRPTTEVTLDQAFALSKFVGQTWFQRLWVVQEVCLWNVMESYPPTFLCGDVTLQWIDLLNTTVQLGRAPMQIINDPKVVTPELRGTYIAGLGWNPVVCGIFVEYYKVQSKQGPVRGLHWYLQRAWQLQATNPADKVYGLLGFVQGQYAIRLSDAGDKLSRQNWQHGKVGGKREIQVDYDLPFQIIYEEVARLILDEEESLNILADAGCGKSRRSQHLPSWVPDWSSSPDEPLLISEFGTVSTANYGASLGTKPILQNSIRTGLLEVGACFFDVVTMEAGRFCGEADHVESPENPSLQHHRIISLKQHILSLWWCFGVKFNKYPTGERPFDVFWRVMIANRVSIGNQCCIPPPTFAESFLMAYPESLEVEVKEEKPQCICPEWAVQETKEQTELHSRVQSNTELGSKETDGETLVHLTEKVRISTECDEEPLPISERYPKPGELFQNNAAAFGEHYDAALRQAAVGRRFFRTRNRYMGIGPRNLTRGDQVVILKGGSLPFILRKVDSTDVDGKPVYSLLGEAYVHGLSEGEGLRDRKDVEDSGTWTRILLN